MSSRYLVISAWYSSEHISTPCTSLGGLHHLLGVTSGCQEADGHPLWPGVSPSSYHPSHHAKPIKEKVDIDIGGALVGDSINIQGDGRRRELPAERGRHLDSVLSFLIHRDEEVAIVRSAVCFVLEAARLGEQLDINARKVNGLGSFDEAPTTQNLIISL